MNAGIPSVGSLKSISTTCCNIRNPTKIRAGAVAALGISAKRGVIKRAKRKRTPVVKDVRPVRPPAATPDDDSTNEVTVEVPRQAPTTVPIESAIRACFAF